MPYITAGKPENPNGYNRFKTNDIEIFISRSLKLKGGRLIIGLGKFMGINKLYVREV